MKGEFLGKFLSYGPKGPIGSTGNRGKSANNNTEIQGYKNNTNNQYLIFISDTANRKDLNNLGDTLSKAIRGKKRSNPTGDVNNKTIAGLVASDNTLKVVEIQQFGSVGNYSYTMRGYNSQKDIYETKQITLPDWNYTDPGVNNF